MRCLACQVDLNENAILCPLCGDAAQDVPPLIEGVISQDYPDYGNENPPPVTPARQKGGGKRLPFREKLKAILHF